MLLHRIITTTVIILSTITTASAQLTPIAYTDGAQKLNGLAGSPNKTPIAAVTKNAGVLILPAWKGIDARAKQSATELASMGYYTFVADIYGEGHYPKDNKEAGAQAGYYKKNITEYQHRIRLALEQLIKVGADSNNIVVIGYCFGGTGALEAARAGMNVKGVVSFHGGLGRDTARTITPITTKVLVLHGADDPFVPATEISAFQDEMRTAKADWQMVYYADAVHAFTDEALVGENASKGAAYNKNAAKRSWIALQIFLRDAFGELH